MGRCAGLCKYAQVSLMMEAVMDAVNCWWASLYSMFGLSFLRPLPFFRARQAGLGRRGRSKLSVAVVAPTLPHTVPPLACVHTYKDSCGEPMTIQ